jgi:sugar O-acyltransferase (sialic acid O-acetyltransferase NeuD family)
VNRDNGSAGPAELVIYGASFPDIVKIVDAVNARHRRWVIAGFIDDRKAGRDEGFLGYPIIGGEDVIAEHRDRGRLFINNVFGSPEVRLSVAEKMERHAVEYATLVAPTVDTAFADIGRGCLISDGAGLGAGVVIRDHVAVRMNAVVNHECVVGNHVFVGPSAVICGRVRIEDAVYVGAGAVIKDGVTLHAGSRIGMGAIVNTDVPRGQVVANAPARPVTNLLR